MTTLTVEDSHAKAMLQAENGANQILADAISAINQVFGEGYDARGHPELVAALMRTQVTLVQTSYLKAGLQDVAEQLLDLTHELQAARDERHKPARNARPKKRRKKGK